MNKDTPLLDTYFSSPILTIVLTIYYYYILNIFKNSELLFDDNLIGVISYYNLFDDIMKETRVELASNVNRNIEILNGLEPIKRKIIFNNIIIDPIIIENSISNYQFNISFVDIINIPNIFKVGYSGTLSIDLPTELETAHNFSIANIYEDMDEKYNVYYALKTNTVMFPNDASQENNLFVKSIDIIQTTDYILNLDSYDAIIDTAGLFKNYSNLQISKLLYGKLSRPIIYLDNFDNVLVYNDNIEPYNSNIKYPRPFFYYSQKHIVGIDIKQDNYPILKGLCIIDKNNTYTEVAQSIFRLRKLNQGHTIQLFCVNKLGNTVDIIVHLLNNNEKNKRTKFPNLVYQTIKANVRSQRLTDAKLATKDEKVYFGKFNYTKKNKIMNVYKEKVKHCFIDNIEDIQTTKKLLYGILTKDEIEKQSKLICILNRDNENNLRNLVYNINSLEPTSEKQNNVEEGLEQNDETSIKIQLESGKVINNKVLIDYSYFNFQMLSSRNYLNVFVNNTISEKILEIPVIIDKEINTCVATNVIVNFSNYFSNLLIVCVESFDENHVVSGIKLTFINSTDMFFYKEYPILNLHGLVINSKDLSDKTIKILKKSNVINLLNYENNWENILKLFIENTKGTLDKEYTLCLYLIFKCIACKKMLSSNDLKVIHKISETLKFIGIYDEHEINQTNNYSENIKKIYSMFTDKFDVTKSKYYNKINSCVIKNETNYISDNELDNCIALYLFYRNICSSWSFKWKDDLTLYDMINYYINIDNNKQKYKDFLALSLTINNNLFNWIVATHDTSIYNTKNTKENQLNTVLSCKLNKIKYFEEKINEQRNIEKCEKIKISFDNTYDLDFNSDSDFDMESL